MAIETQNGDYNLYASAATIYNKTAAADHDLSLEIRFGDGSKNLNAGVGTLTITVINDGGVEGGDSQVVYKGAQTRTVIRTGKLRVSSGKTITITAQSSNSNDTDIDVTVTPRWELQADSHGAAFSNLLFESTVVSYETSEFGTNLYIDGGPNQSGCFNRATVVVYDASNSNAPSFRQVVVSEFDDGDTYLAVSSAFDFTPVAGDLVRVFINPREMALLPVYDPAKTAAQAGDEMALTASARTTLVAALEAEIADDATGEAVKQAIIDKLLENLPEIDDLSLDAIGTAAATKILSTPANKLVTDASGAVVTDATSRTASKNTASEIRTAVGLATANLDTQLGAKATSDELAAVQTHGDSTWATADVSGAATTEALAAAKTVIDTIATDTGETIPAAIAGIEGGGGMGTGARTVAIIVNDGTTALESARVRFTKGAETYVSSTNVSGQVSFSLDDGTWSVAITLAGYSFTPTTLVVDGDETQTYSMMLATVTSSEVGKVTGYWYTLDEEGEVEASVDIELRIVSSSLVGTAHDAAIRTEISDVNGLVQFTNLVKGAKYEARRGTAMRWTQFSVATTATTPYALPDIWGSDA